MKGFLRTSLAWSTQIKKKCRAVFYPSQLGLSQSSNNGNKMAQESYDHLFKLLLVGDSGTGKSNILSRFSDNTFTDAFVSTIGVDFKVRTLPIEGKTAKLQIWDTAGQERFRTITSSYYRGANGILIVYDVTDRESFTHLDLWRNEVLRFGSENVQIIVLANKTDLSHTRQVSTEEGVNYCNTHNLRYFEVSAKTNHQISQTFEALASSLVLATTSLSDARRDAINPALLQEDLLQNISPAPPPLTTLEDRINYVASMLAAVSPSAETQVYPEMAEFQQKVAHKRSTLKLGLSVGEFEEPRSSISLRYKTGSEASSVGYQLELDSESVAIALAFRGTDDADSFRLGELSATIKGLLEPLLTCSKSTFSTNISTEYDGSKVFRLLWEIKDRNLRDALHQLFRNTDASAKLELDLEFSERPTRNPSEGFVFARLNLEVEGQRDLHALLANKNIAQLLKATGRGEQSIVSFLSTLKRGALSLEFDSWDEFWAFSKHQSTIIVFSCSVTFLHKLGRCADLLRLC
jgi:Ras-related protein Rab-1A